MNYEPHRGEPLLHVLDMGSTYDQSDGGGEKLPQSAKLLSRSCPEPLNNQRDDNRLRPDVRCRGSNGVSRAVRPEIDGPATGVLRPARRRESADLVVLPKRGGYDDRPLRGAG